MDVYDARGKRTGRVDHDGTIHNSSGKYMGRVDHDGLVFNSYNSFIGQVHDNGIVKLSNGEMLAWVDDEGAIYEASQTRGDRRQSLCLLGRVSSLSPIDLAGAAAFLFLGEGLFRSWPSFFFLPAGF